MAEKESKVIKEAKESYDVLTGDGEVKRLAEIRLMSHLEEQAALACARENGHEKGMQEGYAQGKKEGLKQGKKDEKIKTAKRLLKLNLSIEQIAEATQLEEKEILELINKK